MSNQPISRFSFFDVKRSVEELSWWLEVLSGDLPKTNLPKTNLADDVLQSGDSEKKEFEFIIEKDLCLRLSSISKGSPLSLYLILTSALKCVLHRYSQNIDSIIGSPVYKQSASKETIGPLVLIRTHIDDDSTFKEILLRVREKTLAAYENQNYPFSEIKEKIEAVNKDIVYQPAIICMLEGIHDKVSSEDAGHDIDICFAQKDSIIEGKIEYDSSKFETYIIEQFSKHFINFLGSALENADTPIARLEMSDEEELSEISQFNEIIQFDDTLKENSKYKKNIISLFEDHVLKSPDAVALQHENGTISYRELNKKANQLAHFLRKNHKTEPGDAIAIMLNRSEHMVVGILGVLKSGGCYVPIDSDYPHDRISYILDDCQCKAVITESVILDDSNLSASYQIINISDFVPENNSDDNLSLNSSPDDLAYIIYTSGSTGMPKGCQIEIKSLFNYITWANTRYFDNKENGRFGLYTSLSFDLTITSVLSPLTRGSSLYIYNHNDNINQILTHSFSSETDIDAIKITPAHISLLKYLGIKSSNIKTAIVGGEQLTMNQVSILKEINENMEIFNEYGPTEATVGCIVKKVELSHDRVLIGRPITNMEAYIFDQNMNPLPKGIAGELYLGGEGISKGYLNRPELNEEKFISHPYKKEKELRIYKTGDICRWLPGGDIECLGRNDDQVKIRGFRVEPGEIENRIIAHPQVDEAAVVAKKIKGDMDLIAYVVGQKDVNASVLRDWLKTSMPDYMIPGYFVSMDSLPLTINGKVDRRALPDPDKSRSDIGTEYAAPRNEIEQEFARIWESILERDNIGIHDNFFELGGHSIKATRLASGIHKTLKIEIGLRDIFDFPTIAGLAAIAKQKKKSTFAGIKPLPEAEHYVLSHAQKRLWLSDQKEANLSIYNIHGAVMLEGNLNIPAFNEAITAVVDRHESLRTTFIVVDGEPRQKICQDTGFKLDILDLSKMPDTESIVKEHIRKEGDTPFDLAKGPLIRAKLLKNEENRYSFIIGIHHIISDGWSMEILMKEVFCLYDKYAAGKEEEFLPKLKIQYKDYAAWHNELLTDADNLKKYWHDILSGTLPVLNTFSDYPRPTVKTYNADVVVFDIDKDLTIGLNKLGKDNNASLFMVLLALSKALFHRYTAQEDIIVGTALAGRSHSDLEDQIGFYVNLLPLRTEIKGSDSFKKVLEKVKKITTEVYDHQLYPFDRLVQELYMKRDPSRFPIFDIAVDLQDNELFNISSKDLKITEIDNKLISSEYDMAFMFTEKNDHITLKLEYNTDLFKRKSVEKMKDRFMSVIKESLKNPDMEIAEIILDETVVEHEDVEITTSFNF